MAGRHYYGMFTYSGQGYSLEGDDSDCLFVERLVSPTAAVPVCMITGRDRNHSWEVVADPPLPEADRQGLVRAAVHQYRAWIVEHR